MEIRNKIINILVTLLLLVNFNLAHSSETSWTGNLLINPGAETGTLDGWISDNDDPTVIEASQSQESRSGTVTPNSGNYFFNMGSEQAAPSGETATRILFQEVDVSTYSNIIDNNNVTAKASVYFQTEDRPRFEGSDFAWLTLYFIDSEGATIDGWEGRFQSPNLAWVRAKLKGTVPPNTRIIKYELMGEKFESTFINAFFDDAVLKLTFSSKNINIDFKPYNKRNIINPQKKGKTWVAILGDSKFDVTLVDISTVQLGPDKASVNKFRFKDVDRNGYLDLLVRFKVHETGISCGDNKVHLIARTFDEKALAGVDTIKTVGCK